jgi:putative flippase GtrA
VSPVRPLPARLQQLAREAAAFGVIGLINTVLDFALFYTLLSLIGPLQANIVSTVISGTSSYAMYRRFTYRGRPKETMRREYLLFFAVNLGGLGIQEAVLAVARYGLGFDPSDDRLALLAFKGLGLLVAMNFRFWAYRGLVFGPLPEPAVGVAPVPSRPPAQALPPAQEFIGVPLNVEIAKKDLKKSIDLDAGPANWSPR